MESEKKLIPDLIFDRDESGVDARMYAYSKAFGRAYGKAKSQEGDNADKSSGLMKELEKTKSLACENA